MSSGSRWRAWLPRLLGCALLLVLGCERVDDALLLDLTGVAPSVVERGDSLFITGAGFPAGRNGQVQLRGVAHMPGAAAVRVDATLAARALSAERAEVRLDDASMRGLPEHGSFEGSLVLRFPRSRAAGYVVGRLSAVQLDFGGALPMPAALDVALRDRASALLGRLGIEPLDAESLHSGLVIATLVPGGPAERAGLHPRDVIVSAGGVSVHALADLAPSESATAIDLQVIRGTQSKPLSMHIAIAQGRGPSLDAASERLVLLCVLLLLTLCFLSPLATPSEWLARLVSRYRALPSRPRVFMELAPPTAAAAGRPNAGRHQAFVTLFALGTLALVVGSLGEREMLHLDVFWLLFGYLAILALAHARKPRRILAMVQWVGLLSIVVAAAAATQGTRTLSGLVAEQGGAPWSIALFNRPQLWLGFGVFIVASARLLRSLRDDSSAAGLGQRLLELSGQAVLALLAAGVFLGGWNLPSSGPDALGAAWCVGSLIFAAKTFLAAWLIALAGVLPLGLRARSLWLAAGLVVVGTAAWLFAGISPELELGLGQVTCATCLLSLSIAFRQVLGARHPMGAAPTHASPFA